MKLSICNEVLADMPFAAQCDFAAAVGYDGIEIAPMTLSQEPHLLPSPERARLRRAAADAGIAITGLHFLLRAPAGLSITSSDAAVRARSVGVMRALCDLGADLGGTVLVHGSPDQRQLAGNDDTEGRNWGAECFAAVAQAAERAGVTYCIEPLSRDQTGFVNTIDEAIALVEAIASPAVRTMVDCSSAARAEAEPIPALLARHLPGGLIAHVHFNDPNRRGPGEGELAFAPIIAALRDGGYAGMAAVEPFIFRPDGPACAARAAGYVRGIMEALEG